MLINSAALSDLVRMFETPAKKVSLSTWVKWKRLENNIFCGKVTVKSYHNSDYATCCRNSVASCHDF